MAIIYISYPELAEILKNSGKLPKQITDVTTDSNSLKMKAKTPLLGIKATAKVSIEQCIYPHLWLKVSGIAGQLLMFFLNLFHLQKIADFAEVNSNGLVRFNMAELIKKSGFSADSIHVENLQNQLKIEIQNFRKI
jgi:hypothetical protein